MLIKGYPGQPEKERELASTNSFAFETKLSEGLLINIKEKRGPRTDLWEVSALTIAHEVYWPFKTNLCFLASRKSII